jgi:hypothetical protein
VSGGGARRDDVRDYERLREASIRDIGGQHLESEVNELLTAELAEINSRDVELVRERLDDIEAALGEAVDGTFRLLFGGSVSKNTFVDGLSDVDALVILDPKLMGATTPRELLDAFAQVLAATHASVGVEVAVGRLAVTMTYPDGNQIQLLPALERSSGLAIADADGVGWSAIHPDRFANKLTAVNEANANQVVRTIKLAKRLLSDLPEDRRLSGYHIESLAIEVFDGYKGRKTPREMLTAFFEGAADRVLRPIKDSSHQSVHVDDYLGDRGSLERLLASDALARIGRRLRYASSRSQWEAMFRE